VKLDTVPLKLTISSEGYSEQCFDLMKNKSSLCAIHWPKCEHIEGSTDFPFQTQFLSNLLEFPATEVPQKENIFHTL
jgi:hypothetical protein